MAATGEGGVNRFPILQPAEFSVKLTPRPAAVRWLNDKPIRDLFWVKVLPKAGVRYRNPHQTRHTYASMMLSAGEHPMWVANQMGHASWTMIGRIYGKWMPEAGSNAGVKAESMFSKNVDHDVDHKVDHTAVNNMDIQDRAA